MREHAGVVGEPATCSYTRTRVPREGKIEGGSVKVRSRALARARARTDPAMSGVPTGFDIRAH